MEDVPSRRIFVAINLSKSVQEQILNLQHQLNDKRLPVNWTPLSNMHLTLLFLGNLSAWDIKKICGIADDVAADSVKFELELRRLEVNKQRGTPRILWFLPKKNQNLTALQLKLAQAVMTAGIGKPPRRRFRPHLTIARFRSQVEADKKILKTWCRQKPQIKVSVDSFAVIASDLSHKPVQHETIHVSTLTEG